MDNYDMYGEMLMSPEFQLEDSDSDDTEDSFGGDMTSDSGQKGQRKRSAKPCKYVPHAEKPQHLVQRRNARERRRVQAVNSAFVKLRKTVPYENKHKRLSKVKTLRTAIDYIRELQNLIQAYDGNQQMAQQAIYSSSPPNYAENSRWLHNSPPQNYHENRLPSYCSREDSSGQWSTNYSESLNASNVHQGDFSSISGHAITPNNHYCYQESTMMYTHRAVAHLASVS